MKMTTRHISLSVRGALMQTDRELRAFVGNLTSDGKPCRTVAEVKALLVDALAEGYEFLPSEGCTNFDPKRGCMGCEKKHE